MTTSSVKVFGYDSGNAAADTGCCMGPIIMEQSSYLDGVTELEWITHLFPCEVTRQLQALNVVNNLCTKLAQHITTAVQEQSPFIVVGGDHSVAIGTWSGAAHAVQQPIGLVWIDAHLDSHTPEDSDSKNIHGMPIASLLGYGPSALTHILNTNPKISHEHLVIVGARDYEPVERALLESLNVTIFFMDDVLKYGINTVFKQAINIASKDNTPFGISIDIDGLDPSEAPATMIKTTPGIPVSPLLQFVQSASKHPTFLGLEIAEFFPDLDVDKKTEHVIAKIMKSIHI